MDNVCLMCSVRAGWAGVRNWARTEWKLLGGLLVQALQLQLGLVGL